jgi:hypothetical protein
MPGATSRPIKFKNTSGSIVPAYGIIRLKGTTTAGAATVLDADQSGTPASTERFYFNSPFDVPIGKYGTCFFANTPEWVLYDTAATPAVDEEWGPATGSFKIVTAGTGFGIVGGHDGTKVLAQALGGASCDSQNCIIQVTSTGSPTGGNFDQDWDVSSTTTTLTFGYNNNAAAYAAILDNHANVASGDITVTGGPLPDATIQIEFKSDLANTDIAIPISDWSSLTGGSGVSIITSKTQLGVP